jgi:hypothetical protein
MTEKEAEILAKIRNKFGPIYCHFQLMDLEEPGEIGSEVREKFRGTKKKNETRAKESIYKIKELLDSLG